MLPRIGNSSDGSSASISRGNISPIQKPLSILSNTDKYFGDYGDADDDGDNDYDDDEIESLDGIDGGGVDAYGDYVCDLDRENSNGTIFSSEKDPLSPRSYLARLTEERRRARNDDQYGSAIDSSRLRDSRSQFGRPSYSMPSDAALFVTPKVVRESDLEPLPLLQFKSEVPDVVRAQSITGEDVPSIPNYIPNGIDNDYAGAGMVSAPTDFDLPKMPFTKNQHESSDILHCPQHSRRLCKWFAIRAAKELQIRSVQQQTERSVESNSGANGETDGAEEPLRLVDYPIYDERSERNLRHNVQASEQTKQESEGGVANPTATNSTTTAAEDISPQEAFCTCVSLSNVGNDANSIPPNNSTCCMVCLGSTSLSFDSNFESGNLSRAVRTDGRQRLMSVNCANLKAVHVPLSTSEKQAAARTFDSNDTSNSPSYVNSTGLPSIAVDQEYTLWCRKDLSTSGNIQWYYFRIETPPDDELAKKRGVKDPSARRVTYPLTVRFNIVNMMKKDALYNAGMRPAVMSLLKSQELADSERIAGCVDKSSTDSEEISGGTLGRWQHLGEDVCYFRNSLTNETVDNLSAVLAMPAAEPAGTDSSAQEGKKKKRKPRHFYTLTWTYVFEKPGDQVYFAHSFPYTYTDLQTYLHRLEKCEKYRAILQRRLLCMSLAGNRCDLLTITSRPVSKTAGNVAAKGSQDMTDDAAVNSADTANGVGVATALAASMKPVVVITARVHPGESNSSYAMHGLLEFLLSDHPHAVALRNTFVFKIVPMLNPDGVIHGNYRCCLAATDLNRRYANCSPILHPSVYALRGLLSRMQASRGVMLYLDLHGHSKNKNVFLYGCDVTQQPEPWVRADMEGRAGRSRMSRVDVITQRIFTRLYPRILCALSSSVATAAAIAATAAAKGQPLPVKATGLSALEQPGYFSYKDTKFNVTKSKRGTGRIVAWKDIGVECAYTVELSFCGLGDSNEGKVLARAEEKGFDLILAKEREISVAQQRKQEQNARKLGADISKSHKAPSLSGSFQVHDKSPAAAAAAAAAFSAYDKILAQQSAVGSALWIGSVGSSPAIANLQSPGVLAEYLEYKEFADSYCRTRHFTKGDMLNVGRDLLLALSEFANLPRAYDYQTAEQSSWQHTQAALLSAPALDMTASSHAPKRAGKTSSVPPTLAVGSLERARRILERPLPPSAEPNTPFYTAAEANNPLLHSPYCFSSDAVYQLQRKFPADFEKMGVVTKASRDKSINEENAIQSIENNSNVGLRVKTELELTRAFGYVFENPFREIVAVARVDSQAGDTGDNILRSCTPSPPPQDVVVETEGASVESRSSKSKTSRRKKKSISKNASASTAPPVDLSEFFAPTSKSTGGNGGDGESEAGSDSDPSVDNVPTDAMLRRLGKSHGDLGNSSVLDIQHILRAAEIKRRRVEAKAVRVELLTEKRRLVVLQRKQFQRYQEDVRRFEEANLRKATMGGAGLSLRMPAAGLGDSHLNSSSADAKSESSDFTGDAGSRSPVVSNPKFTSTSRKLLVPNQNQARREKVATKSRRMPQQKRTYISHAPAYKLSTEYDDDDASSVTAVTNGPSTAQGAAVHVVHGSYFKEGPSIMRVAAQQQQQLLQQQKQLLNSLLPPAGGISTSRSYDRARPTSSPGMPRGGESNGRDRTADIISDVFNNEAVFAPIERPQPRGRQSITEMVEKISKHRQKQRAEEKNGPIAVPPSDELSATSEYLDSSQAAGKESRTRRDRHHRSNAGQGLVDTSLVAPPSALAAAGANSLNSALGVLSFDDAVWDIAGSRATHSHGGVARPSGATEGRHARHADNVAMTDTIRDRAVMRDRERQLQMQLIQQHLNAVTAQAPDTGDANGGSLTTSTVTPDVHRSRGLIRGLVQRGGK